MPEQQQWGLPSPLCPPCYLRLLVHRRVRADKISLLAVPEGGWKESSMSGVP